MIRLIVLDVDGTMTDGKIIYSNSGEEIKSFNVKDGLAIASWTKKMGYKAAIITGRTSEIVKQRAKDLKIEHIYQGIKDKEAKVEEILKSERMTWDEVASIGDDLNDYKMLKKSKLSFCPNDATSYLKDFVNVICESKGGDGAVREMIEYIIRDNGLEEEFLKLWQ